MPTARGNVYRPCQMNPALCAPADSMTTGSTTVAAVAASNAQMYRLVDSTSARAAIAPIASSQR